MQQTIINLIQNLPNPKSPYKFVFDYGLSDVEVIWFCVLEDVEPIQAIKIKSTDTEEMKLEKITNIEKLITEYARTEEVGDSVGDES